MATNTTQLPLNFIVAPFPQGFQGDMDETFQQAFQNTSAWMEGNFLTGLVLPPGSTLPTKDYGPIAMGGTWYFWDPTTNQYLPQSVTVKPAKNFVRNATYQVQQVASTFTVGAGVTQTYDLALCRSSAANVLAISAVAGPLAGADGDLILSAINYTVGPTLVPTLAATDLYAHEHLIEGSDIAMLQGQPTTLSFFVYPTVAGTYSAYLTNGGRDSSYVFTFTISTAQLNAWTRVKIPGIPAFPTTGTWNYGDGVTGLYIGIPLAIGTQWQTATVRSWQNAFYAGTAQNINLCTAVNNQLRITGVKLEAAPSPTYFSALEFGTDFDACQRYYYTSFDYQSSSSGVPMTFVAQATAGAAGSWGFPRRMCKVPTVVPYSTASCAT
jgi:hypothetical protein